MRANRYAQLQAGRSSHQDAIAESSASSFEASDSSGSSDSDASSESSTSSSDEGSFTQVGSAPLGGRQMMRGAKPTGGQAAGAASTTNVSFMDSLELMDADLNFSGPAAGTLEGEVTAVIKNEKNELNRIRNAVEELTTGAREMCAADDADLSAPHLPEVGAERIAAAERRAAQMYYGFIRIPVLEKGNDVIFYCSDVRSDFDLRLRKGDVVELRIAKRSEVLAKQDASGKRKLKAEWVRVKKYASATASRIVNPTIAKTTRGLGQIIDVHRRGMEDVVGEEGAGVDGTSRTANALARTCRTAFWVLCAQEVVEELKRGYAKDTSGVAGQMSFRVGDGSSLALACVLRYCVVSDIDGAADTGDKSGGGATAAPDGHVALLVQEICRNFIFVHRGHAHEQNIPEHSEAEESYGTGIRTRRERFRFPKAHRRGTGTATGSQKNEDSQERLRFFLRVLLAENKGTTSTRGRSATVGSATSRTSAGAHQEKCDDILEAVFVPVLQLCLKNSDLMRNFVLPALRCVRGVLAELQFSSSPARVDTICDDLLLRQSEMLVAARSSRGGGREQSMRMPGGNTTTTPDHLSLLHSWREAALRKPSLRELRDATMMFRDLRDSRVLKALPYDDEQHYMSVYTQLYRTEAYVGLCRQVERVIDLVNRDAGAKKLNFFESKVYRADFLGYYPLQSGPHKGSISLAFAAVPDYALYADDRKKLLKDWPSRGLMTGTLLAVSIDGRFASQAGLLYLTVELRDETQLRDHGVFVAVPVPDPHTAFCGAGWDGASAGPEEYAESVFARIRKIMNAFAGDLSLQKCIRIVENPGFYPAAAPVLRNLAAQRCVPFASSIVRCEPPTVRTAQVGVECFAECEGEEDMLVVETEPSSIYALTATFPKDLVMKVKPDPVSVTRSSKLKGLRNPSEDEDMYTVRQFLLDVAHPKSELHRDSELHQEQLEAIAHVLQHEVSVIQGAPGTGKTFIAVRICLILRAMHRERDRGAGRSGNEARSEPFRQLALSFKNHAVDEFSMDLLDSDMPVVRIGSRSAEPRLREHTLSALVQERARLRRHTPASVLADSDDENNSVHKKNELAALNEEEFAHRIKEIRRRFKMEESLEVTPVIAAAYIDLEQLVNLFGVWAKKNEKMFFERKRRSLPTPAAVAASFLLRQCLPILVYFLNTCRNQGWPLPSLMTIIQFGGAHPEEELVIDPVFEAKMSSEALLQMRSIAHRYFAGNLRSGLANAFCEFVLPAWMPTPQQTHDLAARLRGPILFEDAAMADHDDPPSASTNAQRDQDAGTEKFVSCNFPAAGGQDGVDEADDFSNDDELRRDRALLLEEARAETEFDLVKKISKVERAVDLTGIARPATGRTGDPLLATKIHYLPEIANSGRLKQDPAVKDQLLAQRDLWRLNADDRCRFLQVVLERVAESREAAVAQLEHELSQIAKRRRVAEEADKLAVLTSRKNPVLAMTIDGACIQGELLARCHVDVVIFEEAGELLEAKQLACLPWTARQVIMIGDPLQLPPNPDTFELHEHYDFGTSLMERLISNGYPYRTLMKQSRMHPEISRLSRHVYPRLENHDAVVEELEKCAGLPARVWFWDTGSGAHCTGEVKRVSVTNAGEASRALGLAQKLVYDGVKPSQIGILAMYKGQATLIRGMTRKSEKLGVEAFLAGGSGATSSNQPQAGAGSEARWSKGNPFVASATIGELANRGRNPLGLVGGAAAYAKLDFDEKEEVHEYGSIEDVTVDSVDNFQGDQRDYIIVSFCRSNENHDCGFLKKSDTGAQRLNVALTRARCGVFLIGYRDCLQTDYLTTGKDRVTRARLVDRTKKIANPVFKNVFADLEASNLVGRKLPLSCPRHPENENLFCETAADWERGTFKCRMVCGLERSDCDHTCSLQCHPGECAAYRCHEMVSFECENDESHPSWEAPCFEKKAGAKCRQIVEFECSRCKDDTVFSAAAEKLAAQSRRTLLRRQCFESQAAAERKCPATYEYTCKAGDHTHMRNCCENEIGKCERPTERLRKCGHRYQLPCYEFDNIFKGKGRFAEAGTTNDSDTEVEDDAAEMLAKYDNEPCMEIVREACARCGEGSLRRICSSAASEDQCDRVFDHTCQSCGAVGQRACSLPAEQFRCVKLLDEVCKNCNAAPVQRICSEPEPIAPCSHNIRHVCETCRVAGEKVCSEAYVCKTTSTHHCATCGQDAEIPCGHSEADFVCPTPTPFYCPVCNAFVKYYPCGASPTPRQLEEEFVCVAEVAHVCRRCDAEGTRPCAQPVHEYFCPQPCRKALPFCGHPCHRACGLPCPRDESECRLCALEKSERWLAEGCLSEEKTQEFAENSRCLLPTWQIEFTQASISEDMRSGTSVAGEAQDVMSRSPQLLDPENFEKRYKQLNVYKWEECEWVVSDSEPRQVWRTRFMSLDNRRLALLKLCKPGGSVWVNISGDEKDFHFKYDPKNRKKLAHDEIRQVGAGGAVAGKAGAGGGAARTVRRGADRADTRAAGKKNAKLKKETTPAAAGGNGGTFSDERSGVVPDAHNGPAGAERASSKRMGEKADKEPSKKMKKKKEKAKDDEDGNAKSSYKKKRSRKKGTENSNLRSFDADFGAGTEKPDEHHEQKTTTTTTQDGVNDIAVEQTICPAPAATASATNAIPRAYCAVAQEILHSPTPTQTTASSPLEGEPGRAFSPKMREAKGVDGDDCSVAFLEFAPSTRDVAGSAGGSPQLGAAPRPQPAEPREWLAVEQFVWKGRAASSGHARMKNKGRGKFLVCEEPGGAAHEKSLATAESRVLEHYLLPIEPQAHHDDEALSSNLKEQRLVEAVQKYRFADEAACAPTVDKQMLCIETWAGVSLMENEGDGREQGAVADPSSSALLTSTRNLKRAATGSLDVALRMMLSSASATEWMGVRSTSKGARGVGDRRPVVVMNQGLLHLLSVLHTDYMQERFPRFEFHAYFDATTGLLFLWNSLQEMFPDRVKQHGEGGAKEIARKAGVKSRIYNRFAEHLVKSVVVGGDNGESENSTTFSRSRMNFGNVTELPSYPCSLLRVETLDQFFPVFAPSVSRDPSFLLYGCSPMLYVNGNGDAGTTRTATASTALNRTNKNGTRSTGNNAQCFLQCRRANPKTRAAHDSGWTDKKAVAKMFYGGNAYRLYAKLACGGSAAVALGFHDDAGRVESVLRIDTLDEYRQTFSYSLNHDLAQGGEVLGGVFAWLLDHVSTEELANQCVTAVKEDLRDQLAPGVEERNVVKGQQSSKGKARKGDEAGKGAGKTFGGPGGGYASEVRLRLGKAQAGTDYREELLAKIADFCEKWKQAETHGN